MEVSSSHGKALLPDIYRYLQDGVNEHPDFSPAVFNVTAKTAGVIKYDEIHGPGLVNISSENASTPEADFTPGYSTQASPLIWKMKMGISEELRDWNKYQNIFDRSKALGSAVIHTINRYTNSVWINAFSSSYLSYGDNLALCSTVHTRSDGGSTQSNSSTTSIALTEANLETAMIAMKQSKQNTGKKLNVVNGKLISMVPEALEKEAVIITGSTKRSGTGNNDLNYYQGKIGVLVNPWIGSDIYDIYGNQGSDTAWFLLAMNTHQAYFNWDKRPTYNAWENDDLDSMWVKVKFRGMTYWTSWLGIWGSKGKQKMCKLYRILNSCKVKLYEYMYTMQQTIFPKEIC